jgi:hypothetical protein
MIAPMQRSFLVSRRTLLVSPLAILLYTRAIGKALAPLVEREQIATIERAHGLTPPLTLGIAKVVLRPGAVTQSAIPGGARMIAVESGVLAVSVTPSANEPLSAREFSLLVPEPDLSDELFVPAGTTITFASRGVTTVRNPGARSVVALDVVVYTEAPRPLARAFTTEEGVSFQLLASANAAAALPGGVAVTLERVRLGQQAELPADLSIGLMLARVGAGTLRIRPDSGEVFAARAAASTPYSMPGSLEPIPTGDAREVTAGGVVFLPVGSAAAIANPVQRSAEVMILTMRESG